MLPRPALLRHARAGRPPVWLSRNGVTARRWSLWMGTSFADVDAQAAQSRTGGPVVWMVPSGTVMVRVRSGCRVRRQPPSWAQWWCRLQSGRRLSKSVGPPCSQQCTWCGFVNANATQQPGTAQVGYIARSARRWARNTGTAPRRPLQCAGSVPVSFRARIVGISVAPGATEIPT